MNILAKLPAYFAALTLGITASAHEYWIQPDNYVLESGANIVANVRVGEDFKGNAYAYFPDNFNRFEVLDSNGSRPITGRIGDTPAIDIETSADGLHVLTQFTTSSRLEYTEFEAFETFVNTHGMPWVLAAHAQRGLPETGFSEGYTRFVKSLVALGDGAGQDRFTGMLFEIVANANPYTDDISRGLPVRVLFEGAPIANTQIDIFYRTLDQKILKSAVVTDADGTTTIPNFGAGEYMVNAVHMVIPVAADIERTGVVWHSLWASLTFEFSE